MIRLIMEPAYDECGTVRGRSLLQAAGGFRLPLLFSHVSERGGQRRGREANEREKFIWGG